MVVQITAWQVGNHTKPVRCWLYSLLEIGFVFQHLGPAQILKLLLKFKQTAITRLTTSKTLAFAQMLVLRRGNQSYSLIPPECKSGICTLIVVQGEEIPHTLGTHCSAALQKPAFILKTIKATPILRVLESEILTSSNERGNRLSCCGNDRRLVSFLVQRQDPNQTVMRFQKPQPGRDRGRIIQLCFFTFYCRQQETGQHVSNQKCSLPRSVLTPKLYLSLHPIFTITGMA